MKTNFVRVAKLALVAASALAFMNCDDSVAAADPIANVAPSSSSVLDNPNVDPVTGLPVADPASSAATAIDPVTGEPIVSDPASSAAVAIDPVTGEPVNPVANSSAAVSEDPIVGESSASVDPIAASSASVDPIAVSSSSVKEASSSSEKVVSSSSEVVQQAPKGIFLATDTDENKNYMEVEYFTKTGDNGGGVLAYPKRLSDTQKHGVVLWGPGGGTEPTAYEGIIRRLASHGFVVIATSESPDGTNRGKPALDWLAKKNETPGDPLYQKLDMTKVGASGHSMGGLQSEEMLIADDRVITAVLNNSGDMGHADGARVPATKTFAIVYGEGGMERPNAEADYGNAGVKAPACLIKMTGGQGNECQNGECGWGHGSGPWGGMAATVAWMRWHLGGEDFRKADFVGSTGRYIDGAIVGEQGKWKGQCKNF